MCILRKKKKFISMSLLLISLMFIQCCSQPEKSKWRTELEKDILLYGHRNWILVVDAAYPYQGKQAIKTIATGESQLYVLKEVLNAIGNAEHVSAEIFLDKEIDFVSEEEAPGINNYTEELQKLLSGEKINKILHEEMIEKVDDAANTFQILVLKTEMTIPYTSVFLRLDCGYWNTEQEQNLRNKMKIMEE